MPRRAPASDRPSRLNLPDVPDDILSLTLAVEGMRDNLARLAGVLRSQAGQTGALAAIHFRDTVRGHMVRTMKDYVGVVEAGGHYLMRTSEIADGPKTATKRSRAATDA